MVDGQVDDYMESLKRTKEAIEKLQELRYAAGDASIIGLVISVNDKTERTPEKRIC